MAAGYSSGAGSVGRAVPADAQRIAAELAAAREAFERGRHARAIREVWDCGRAAARLNDEAGLEAVVALATEIRDTATGRQQENAAMTVTYFAHCLADARSGVRSSSSALGRLFGFGRGGAEPTKRCPDCAETIKAAAKVCRFCGYRFE